MDGGGQAPGSRLSVFNASQWAGDYAAGGIGAISMDVRNLGNTELDLRLALFSGPPLVAPAHVGFTTAGRALAPGSGWSRVTFTLDPASLTMLLGSASELLAAVTELRLFHGTTFPPDTIVATLGIDNITAERPAPSVPEPGSAAALALGLAAVVSRRTRRGEEEKSRRVEGKKAGREGGRAKSSKPSRLSALHPSRSASCSSTLSAFL